MLETLKEIDRELFVLINSSAQNSLFDLVCPFMRKQSNWYLLYAVLGYFLYEKYRIRSLWVILGAALLVLVSDQVSANLIKNTVQRLRPCNDPDFKGQVRLLANCGSGFSFISAHATNHFAIAVFIGSFFRELKWALPLALAWAFVIAFSQVYVGVHYPFDVICGGVLGCLLGYLFYTFISRKVISKPIE